MIFLDKMKNLKIYKTQMFLPTLEDDKKKQSLIMLLSPNYEASNKMMNFPLFVNKLRYSSYYLEKDISFYIGGKVIEDDDTTEDYVKECCEYQSLSEMTAAERNKLPDSAFGLPEERKYPLDTEEHVRSAIKFFNYVSKDKEEELAKNIIKAMKKFNITDVEISNKNRLSKYIKSTNEAFDNNTLRSCPICNNLSNENKQIELYGNSTYVCKECYNKFKQGLTETDIMSTSRFLQSLDENDYIKVDDKVIVFNENKKYDSQLKKLLFKSRLRKRKDVTFIYDKVLKDNSFIKYIYYDLGKYRQKNLFVDLYFYNNTFFANNNWNQLRGFNLYYDFLERLINDNNYKLNGYKKRTIFIPVSDWDRFHDYNVWNYKKNINPISIIYQMLYTNQLVKLKSLFKDSDLVFIGQNNYFKINLNQITEKDNIKILASKFRSFLVTICKNEEFAAEDIDTSADNVETPDVIKTNVADKLDINKGIDIVPHLFAIKKAKENKNTISLKSNDTVKNINIKKNEEKKIEDNKPIDTLSKNKPEIEIKKKAEETKKEKLAQKIYDASEESSSEEELYDLLDLDDDEVKSLLTDLQSSDDNDQIDLSVARSSRMSELDNQVEDKSIHGTSIRDIISTPTVINDIKTSLPLDTPNTEWKNLSYINFDKNYNIDKDLVNCFRHFSKVSRPLAIRNIEVQNTSTTEDRIETYKVDYEDYRGKRYTVKLDIPIMKDNRFLLRGNNKSIQTQMQNIPIIKTDVDACQIVSNYMKIFVYRFGDQNGKALPITSRIGKALLKYKGTNIKISFGNNQKISSKYQLPIDYIGLGNMIAKIETSDFIVYFNQDEIRKLYEVKEGLGVPYLYNKKTKELEYLPDNHIFSYDLYDLFLSNEKKYLDFISLIDKSTDPKSCAYSRCSIMNTMIPTIIICAYHEGLREVLRKANIKYELSDKLTMEQRKDPKLDYIKFSDGYLIYEVTYASSLLLNGLKTCDIESCSIKDIDDKNTYLEFLDNFGGRIKADGLENFYDLMIDSITEEILSKYNLPTDYVSVLLYANAMLADNKYIKHTNISTRRFRRYELIVVYTYKVLADAYASYANELKHLREAAEFKVKQSAVIDKFLLDPISSDDSCINALRDVETTNAITTKGPSGMNSDRAYSLDKRSYDPSMNGILGMSTGFAANVGITRQATIDANISNDRGFVKLDDNIENMNTSKTLTAVEALTPFGCNRDDPFRTAMTFVQTSKHMVRTAESDPLLVTSGADEAMAYLTTDRFAFKAKKPGIIKELTKDYMIIQYNDNTNDYIGLTEIIEKNSDGGYYVPLKLDVDEKLKVGDKFDTNQVLAYDKLSFSKSLGESDKIAYNIGTLTKVAVINSDECFEDSGIMTESLAKKLATRINLQYSIVLEKDVTVYKFLKVGDTVEVDDPLVVWQESIGDQYSDDIIKALGNVEEYSDLGKRQLKSEVTGKITSVKIYRTVETSDMSESLRTIVENYEKYYNQLEKKMNQYNLDTSSLPPHKLLPPTGKLKKAQDAVWIDFTVEYEDTVSVGDKAVAYSANKSVCKKIIPKGKEAYTEFRPNEKIDYMLSEVSIDKRMVSSTLLIGSLNKLLVELDRSIKDILEIPYDDSKI